MPRSDNLIYRLLSEAAPGIEVAQIIECANRIDPMELDGLDECVKDCDDSDVLVSA